MQASGGEQRARVLTGVVAGLAVLVVVVSAVLWLGRIVPPFLPLVNGSTPTPDGDRSSIDAPRPSDHSPLSRPQLPGSGAAVVFVQSAAAIYRVDLASGDVRRTLTLVELAPFSSFVATSSGVVSKAVGGDSGVIVRDDGQVRPLPAGLSGAGRLYPAGNGSLWLVPEYASGGRRDAIRVDLAGERVDQTLIRIPDEFGIPGGDQAGHLLITNAGGAYQAGTTGLTRLGTGELLAIGSGYVLTWDCDDRARCHTYRLDRTTGKRVIVRAARQAVLNVYTGSQSDASSYSGVLSANGTHAAIAGPPHGSDDRPISVVDLRTGTVDVLPGAETDVNAQVTWTPNSRWLLALTDGQLRAYDTTTRQVSTLQVSPDPLQHLSSAQGSGF